MSTSMHRRQYDSPYMTRTNVALDDYGYSRTPATYYAPSEGSSPSSMYRSRTPPTSRPSSYDPPSSHTPYYGQGQRVADAAPISPRGYERVPTTDVRRNLNEELYDPGHNSTPRQRSRVTPAYGYDSHTRSNDYVPQTRQHPTPQTRWVTTPTSMSRTNATGPVAATAAASSPGRICRTPSMNKDHGAFLPRRDGEADTLCLVLDLDETLVYARNGPVQVRPHARSLLSTLEGADAEVVVWTAGERDYAQSVIRQIDTTNTVQHCVYRHHKWWTGRPGYTKNLRSLGRNINRTVIVDNTPDCLRDYPDNAILVSDYEGGQQRDDSLRVLLDVLLQLAARPWDSVPDILRDSPDVVQRTVPCDAGGSVRVWTLVQDSHLGDTAYHQGHVNRDVASQSRYGQEPQQSQKSQQPGFRNTRLW
jgi:hypothetical protein